jgi:hypothetical protein
MREILAASFGTRGSTLSPIMDRGFLKRRLGLPLKRSLYARLRDLNLGQRKSLILIAHAPLVNNFHLHFLVGRI